MRKILLVLLTLLAIPVSAWALPSASQPPGFEPIVAYGSVVRVRTLPLRVFSADARFDAVYRTAIGHWNAAAQACGLPAPFEAVSTPEEADFAIDWSGQGLPSRALAATHTTIGMVSAHVRGVTVRGDGGLPPGNLCEVLMQELGHVLGLGHSQDPRDVMYERAHREPRDLRWVRLMPRDVQMLSWLYSQESYIPLLHAHQSF